MRGTRGLAVVTACVLASFLAGCFNAEFGRDGAGCSQEGTCPPGQVCSTDGQCLFPCPTPDCVNETCGCVEHTHLQISEVSGGYLCLADGLCHLKCIDYLMDCPRDLVCGPNGLCLPRCGEWDGCPNDAACQTPIDDDWYCQGGDLDGGVVGDGGICTDCPGSGCVYLATDPEHCGSCDHACQTGESCVDGTCQPRVLAQGPVLTGGAVMAFAGDIVYWTVQASQGVYACARSFCESPTLVCGGADCGSPTALVVGASSVFWIDENAGDARILTCPLGGCTSPPTVVAEGLGRATALAYDGPFLYFSSSEGLQRCPEVDCTGLFVELIHAADFSTDTVSLAVDESDVVWTSFNDGAVRRCPKAGCTSTPLLLAQVPGSFPASVTMDPAHISWVMYGLGEVQRCPLSGCDPVPETVGSFPIGEPSFHVSSLALLPDGVVVIDNDHAMRYCVYYSAGASCDKLGPAETSVWTTVTTSAPSVLFGAADGRILELAAP